MGQARDEAGNIWETDAQGNAVRLVQPAQSAPAAQTFGTPDPTRGNADRRAEEAARRSAAADARAAAAADRLAREWAATHKPDGTPLPKDMGGTAKPPTEYQAKSAGFLGRLMEAERMFGAVPEGSRDARTVPGQWFHDTMPGIENSVNSPDRQKADQAARNFIAASLRQESGAAISAGEFDNQYKIFFPMPGDSPEVIAQKAEARRQAIEGFKIAAGPLADRVAAQPTQKADPEVDPVTGMVKADANTPSDPGPLPPANEPGGNTPTPAPTAPASGGGTHSVARPDIASMVKSMLAAGAGFATINSALKGKNARPLSFSEFNDAKKGRGIVATEDRPLSLMERAAGSAGGAFTAQMANAATAGIPAYMAGDQGKGAIDAMQTMHPTASTLGMLTGGVTGAMGGEALLAARAPAALAGWAPRAADALYGGVSGYTGSDGDLGQAALGAVTAPIAGAIGQRAMHALGSGLRGVANPAVERLRAAGIPLTVGQVVGQSGRVGNVINKAEQALTSIPGVGSMVAGRFDDGTRGLNRAAFEVGAQTTGNQVQDVGSAGVEQLRQIVGNTYDNALTGARLDVTDPAVAQDIINAQMVAGSIPQVGQNAIDAIDYRVGGGTGLDGTMDGRDFQEAYRGLGRDGRAAARDSYGHEYQGAMGQAQDALASGLEAQNPGAYEGFVNANTANRRAMVLADAVNAAKNQTDEMFTPAQLNAADANSATRLTGRMNSASGNRPFHQLAQDAQQVMGNRLPNSGTADRAMTGLLLGGLTGAGAGAGAGYLGGDTSGGATGGAALAALLMAGGTRTGQRALVSALADRPAALRTIATAIQNRAQLGGGFGAGILTPLLVGQ